MILTASALTDMSKKTSASPLGHFQVGVDNPLPWRPDPGKTQPKNYRPLEAAAVLFVTWVNDGLWAVAKI